MRLSTILSLTIITVFVINTENSFCQTNVGGFIFEDTKWTLAGSPYVVQSDVIFTFNLYAITLTIEPGVIVKFNPGTSLYIGSNLAYAITPRLIAVGTSENPIIFTTINEAQPQPGQWNNIYFYESGLYESILKYCIIEYGKVVKLIGASPTISNCEFREMQISGLQITKSSSALITDNYFHELPSAIMILGGNPTISDNIIDNCSDYGIYCNHAYPMIKNNNLLENNIAVYCTSSAQPIINFNNILANTTYGVQNTTASLVVDAKYNWWGHASGPSGEGPGTGDVVSEYVDFGTFLDTPYEDQYQPPAPFALLSPIDGDTLESSSINLKWESTIDPDSGDVVTYNLYISKDLTFANPDSVAGLSDTTYNWLELEMNQKYHWKVKACDTNTGGTWCNDIFGFVTESPVGVDDQPNHNLSLNFGLHQNYPNPFNPSTNISFDLPKSSHVNITVYNSLGEFVDIVIDKNMPAGNHSTTWIPKNLSSGIYFYKIQVDKFSKIRKCILIK